MKSKIVFRADASATIGYGHFIRTLALADMLKEDFDCVFYTVEPSAYQIGELQKVCPYVPLSENTKFDDFLNSLDGSEIVVLDNYFYTTDYFQQVKSKGCKLVCIDDMHDKHYIADAIINHGPVDPNEFDVEPYTKLCLGKEWVLLRKPFLSKVQSKERNNTAVINFGGADPYHLTDKVITMLLQMDAPYKLLAILGDKVFLSEDNRKRIIIKNNLTAEQMAELFESSAFGILPASTVSMEATSRGLPLMIGYYVDNQAEGYEKDSAKGGFIPLGNLLTLTKERLASALSELQRFKVSIPDYTKVPDNFRRLFNSL